MYKVSLISISIYLIISPYFKLPGLGLFDSKRILQLLLLIIIGQFVLKYTYLKYRYPDRNDLNKQHYIDRYAIGLCILLIVSGFVSTILSNHIDYAFFEYSFFLLLISGLFLLIPLTLRDHYYLGKLVFITALLYSSLYLIIFFGNYISSFYDQMMPVWPDRLDFTYVIDGIDYHGTEVLYFLHKRFFNHTQTWTLPLLCGFSLVYLKKNPTNWIIHALLFLLISCWWMLVYASGARGTFISLIIALLIISIVLGKTIIPYVKYSFGTAISGSLLYILLFRLFVTDQAPMVRTSDSGRLNMWERAVELWIQEPIFGIGPLHYAEILDSSPYFSHPHNFYIQFLSEWGLIAFLALIGLLILVSRMVIINYKQIQRNPANKLIYTAFFWSMSSALVHASLSGVMHTPLSQVWFILVVAWLLGYMRYNNPGGSKRMVKLYGLRIVFLVLLCAVLFVTVNDIIGLSEGYMEYINRYPDSHFYPRFWKQGLFE